MNRTKSELLAELKVLLNKKGMYKIDGINFNSTKGQLINAINCLKCQDEELEACLKTLEKGYPNIYKTITNNATEFESFKYHSHNRLYVYNTAHLLSSN